MFGESHPCCSRLGVFRRLQIRPLVNRPRGLHSSIDEPIMDPGAIDQKEQPT